MLLLSLCPWGIFGLIWSLLSLIIGIIAIVSVTKWIKRKGWGGQGYAIALLLVIALLTYASMHYDVKKLKCGCAADKQEKPAASTR